MNVKLNNRVKEAEPAPVLIVTPEMPKHDLKIISRTFTSTGN